MNDNRHGTAQPGLIFGIELREFFFADVFNVLVHVFWVRWPSTIGRVDSEKAAGESGGRMWVEDHIGETPTKREAIRLLIYVITAGVDLFCLDAEHWREKVHPQQVPSQASDSRSRHHCH